MLKLHHLQYFSAVCQHNNNITQTANDLHVSQPAITAAIRDLETLYNIDLFTRENKRLVLTDAGRHCLMMANQVLRSIDLMNTEMNHISPPQTTLYVGFNWMQAPIIPHLLKQFSVLHPEIQLRIYDFSTRDILDALQEENLHIGYINLGTRATLEAVNQLEYISLPHYESLVFCTYPNHPLANRKFVTISDICDTPLALLRAERWTEGVGQLELYFKHENKQPNVIYSLNTITGITSFVAAELASTIISNISVYNDARLVKIPIKGIPPKQLGLALLPNKRLNKELLTFIRFMEDFSLESLVYPALE